MDKKKLKTLLKLLGFGLIIGAIVVTLVTGIEKVGHYEFIKGFVATGHEFCLEYVEFRYAVPLMIAGIISLIISYCIIPENKKED